MAPLKPHWRQPSHPDRQEVIINEADFSSKSLSRIAVPPFGLFADLTFPPCTVAEEPTYATCQVGQSRHVNLNSDLLYMNHSCEPSLIIDTSNMQVLAGPRGLKPGDELTFFYPSTEWSMAQPFDCVCGTSPCRGRISGARDMRADQLEGYWLSGHVRELKREQQQQQHHRHHHQTREGEAEYAASTSEPATPTSRPNHASSEVPVLHTPTALDAKDPTVQALQDALQHAEKVVEAAKAALNLYVDAARGSLGAAEGSLRRAQTSRELSGEMGGDTVSA